ncbi:histidine kinase [Kovacikia minuta CCNUW1]|uniref:histidine kinase n=1 Tax=Kovacikia minuta TaxID=2931930 RepID=UPI001CC9486E|nr:histidine kinase [Kovacikia minuta]UBF27752.1 histidine kinase [Kovacikia minuta CCNUW1]
MPFSGAIASLHESSKEAKEEITASVEGIIDGISQKSQEKISQTEAEIQRLQAELTRQEEALEQQVQTGLAGIQEAGKEAPAAIQEQIETAIATLQDSEEVALLKKRYAQLQAQIAIVRANLAANSGTYYDRARSHLEDAKNWYSKARPKAEEAKHQADQTFEQVQQKIGDAGTALAQRERHVRRRLSELLYYAAELVREGRHKPNDQSIAQLPSTETSSLEEEVKR